MIFSPCNFLDHLECVVELLFLNLEDRLPVLQAGSLSLHTPVILLNEPSRIRPYNKYTQTTPQMAKVEKIKI